MQLIKSLFERHYDHNIKDWVPANCLFGLCNGQMRSGSSKIAHNNGWYNGLGEWIGWGDLSVKDLQRISREIEADETFIAVLEYESKKDASLEHVANNAKYIVQKDKIYTIYEWFTDADRVRVKANLEKEGQILLSPLEAREMLLKYRS